MGRIDYKSDEFAAIASAYSKSADEAIEKKYAAIGKPVPPNYQSKKDALVALREKRLLDGDEKSIPDVAGALVETVSIISLPAPQKSLILAYDYDTGVYSADPDLLCKYALAAGLENTNCLDKLLCEIENNHQNDLTLYQELPPYKRAFANGIYDFFTKQLSPFSPLFTICSKIETPYIKKKRAKTQAHSFMGFVSAISRNDQRTMGMVLQLCKDAMLGVGSECLFVLISPNAASVLPIFRFIEKIAGGSSGDLRKRTPAPRRHRARRARLISCGVEGKKKNLGTALRAATKHATMRRMEIDEIGGVGIRQIGADKSLSGQGLLQRLKQRDREEARHRDTQSIDLYEFNDTFFVAALSNLIESERYTYTSSLIHEDRQEAAVEKPTGELGEFLEFLLAAGALSGKNQVIPNSHLFAAYCAWSTLNSRPVRYTSKGFSHAIKAGMHCYGYVPSIDVSPTRASTLHRAGMYHPELFGELARSEEFTEARISDATTRTFEAAQRKTVSFSRESDLSLYEYLRCEKSIVAWAKEAMPKTLENVQHTSPGKENAQFTDPDLFSAWREKDDVRLKKSCKKVSSAAYGLAKTGEKSVAAIAWEERALIELGDIAAALKDRKMARLISDESDRPKAIFEGCQYILRVVVKGK